MLTIKCPKCGQEGEVADEAIDRVVRCKTCHAKGPVHAALIENGTPSDCVDSSKMNASRQEKMLLRVGLGLPAVILLGFLVYWYGIRDTWEQDHYAEIMNHCALVLDAVYSKDDVSASAAYYELEMLVGDRTLGNETLSRQLQDVEEVIVQVLERRREVDRQKREAIAQADSQAGVGSANETIFVAFIAAASNYEWITAGEIQRAYDKAQTASYSYRCPKPIEFAAIYVLFRQRGMTAFEIKETLYSMLQFDDTSQKFEALSE